jgi:hypothetical protein
MTCCRQLHGLLAASQLSTLSPVTELSCICIARQRLQGQNPELQWLWTD